jgi:hypothetical protein
MQQGRAEGKAILAGLNLFQPFERPLVPHIARVEDRRRLEKQDVGLFLRHGPVFDAARHDQKFAFFQPHLPIAKFHAEPPLDHEEEFILVVMMMPYKRSLELDQLHVLAIQFPSDLGAPMLAEAGKLLAKIDFVHDLPLFIN